jgi:hypothetical protein
MKEWKMIYQAYGPGVVILISDKGDFKIRRDKEGYFILIKEATQQEKITVINLYVPNIGASNFIKHTLLDLKNSDRPQHSVVGDFNTSLSPTDRSPRQKINKESLEFNDHIVLMDLLDIYRVFHPVSAQYTFFSATHGTFSKIDHFLDYKASLFLKKIFISFICAYNVWSFLPPYPRPLPYTPTPSLTSPYPLPPGRNYSALISNFVVERVQAITGRNKGFC